MKIQLGTKKPIGEYSEEIQEEDIITAQILKGNITCKTQVIIQPISKNMTEAWVDQCRRICPELLIQQEVKEQ